MMLPEEESPATPTAKVLAMGIDWPMIDALLGGTRTMRAAGKAFLPQFPAEGDENYKYRLSVSTLFNGFGHTVSTLGGKPFGEPVKLGEDVPPLLAKYAEDIDLEGRSLHAFAQAVFQATLSHGMSHIFIDYPTTPEYPTLEDRRIDGPRPYFVHVRASQLLGWRSERINGVETLTQLRFMETIEEPAGQWGIKEVKQVRVLTKNGKSVYWETYRLNDRHQWTLFDTKKMAISAIPFVTVYGKRMEFMVSKPPLLDLAYLNVEHWQSSSDQQNILRVARVPILYGAGFSDQNPITIGAGLAVTNEDPQAKLTYTEHTGAAIGAGRDSLKDLEERMRVLGAQLMLRRQGATTATGERVDSEETNSSLSAMVENLEDALDQALQLMADWDNLPAGGHVEVSKNFGLEEDETQDISALFDSRRLGILSSQTIFHELQRRDVVSDERTWEEESALLKKEGLPPAVAGNYEGANPAP